jgi:hypothetical protein
MFAKYNGVLRGLQSESPFLRNTMVKLCCPSSVSRRYLGDAKIHEQASGNLDEALTELNKYATTLHGINSAVIKLGKLTLATRVYRGVAGMALPKEFWKPNQYGVRGGVECARVALSRTHQRHGDGRRDTLLRCRVHGHWQLHRLLRCATCAAFWRAGLLSCRPQPTQQSRWVTRRATARGWAS